MLPPLPAAPQPKKHPGRSGSSTPVSNLPTKLQPDHRLHPFQTGCSYSKYSLQHQELHKQRLLVVVGLSCSQTVGYIPSKLAVPTPSTVSNVKRAPQATPAGGPTALVPVLYLAVPAGGGNPAVLQRVPLGVDADLVVGLDVAVGLAALPVPEPDLALPVPRDDVLAVWRKAGLAGVAGACVTLQSSGLCFHAIAASCQVSQICASTVLARLFVHQVLMHGTTSCEILLIPKVTMEHSQGPWMPHANASICFAATRRICSVLLSSNKKSTQRRCSLNPGVLCTVVCKLFGSY